MRRRFIILAAAGLLTIGGGVGEAKTVVEHWHNSWAGAGIQNYLTEMEAKFEALHPDIDVKIDNVAGNQYADKLVTSTASGTAPDVVEWWPGPTTPFVVDGLFEDLGPYFKRDKLDPDIYIPSAIDSFKWDGTLWGVPSSSYPFVTLYNTQRWTDAGLVDPYDLGDAWSWDAVIQNGKKLTQTTAGSPARYGVMLTYDNVARAEVYVHEAGGAYFDQPVNPSKSYFDSEEAVTALNWMYELAQRQLIPPEYPNISMLLSGKVATALAQGPQQIPHSGLSTPIGIAPMPKGPVSNATFLITDGWMMSAGSKHKLAAWEWLKFISTDVANLRRFTELTGRIPSLIKALPYYVDSLPAGALHGDVVPRVAVASSTRVGLTQHPAFDQIQETFVQHVVAVRNGQESPRSALEQIQARVSKLLE